MAIRTIRWPEERDAILDHVRLAYGTDEYEQVASWYGTLPGFDPADCFVIDGDHPGEIAAHGSLVPRVFQIGDSPLPAAEIGLLSVLDAYRGRGYESLLLEALHQRMSEREFVLSISFGDPTLFGEWQYEYAVGLYLTSFESEISLEQALRAGNWSTAHSYERRMADWLGANNREVAVRRYYSGDLSAIQALYAEASARGHYCLARHQDVWTWQIEHLLRTGRNDPDDFLVAEVDGRLVAYARLITQGPINVFRDTHATRFNVVEAGGSHPDGIEALLAQIAHTAQTLNIERIGLFVHPQSAFMQHALVRGARLRHFTGAALMRLHNLALTLYLLEPTLESRRLNSRFAPRPYRLVVTTEHDQAEVFLGMGEPEVVELEVPSTSLVRLFTGWYGIDNLAIGYSERHADLLRVLFPKRDPKIGLVDLL
jgi:predicted N-acetyltransferase YhbS